MLEVFGKDEMSSRTRICSEHCDDLNCLKNDLLSAWKKTEFLAKEQTLSFFFFCYKFLIFVSGIAVSQRSLTHVAHMSTYTINTFPANLYVPEDITIFCLSIQHTVKNEGVVEIYF